MLQRFVYALDANGNRTSVTASGSAVATPGTETYTLDALNRLTGVTYGNGDAVAYEYDANGNRTRLTTTPAGGQPVVAGYTYDDADQLTSDGSLTYAYDLAGNLTSAGTSSFTWDWRGRLASATTGAGTTSYAYDGDGVRVGKAGRGTTTPFLWDRTGGLPLLVGDGTQTFLHATGVLAGVDGAGTATYTLLDGLGSVRGRTDGTGALVGAADYDAFGAVRAGTGASGAFGWAGEQVDPETGQVHLRARQYAPGLGRFLTAVPEFPAKSREQDHAPRRG